jgi:hypothetical protein
MHLALNVDRERGLGQQCRPGGPGEVLDILFDLFNYQSQ